MHPIGESVAQQNTDKRGGHSFETGIGLDLVIGGKIYILHQAFKLLLFVALILFLIRLFWFQVSGVSPAAGLKSGQSNHQETVPFW
jgi:hypothetical protein